MTTVTSKTHGLEVPAVIKGRYLHTNVSATVRSENPLYAPDVIEDCKVDFLKTYDHSCEPLSQDYYRNCTHQIAQAASCLSAESCGWRAMRLLVFAFRHAAI